MLKYIKYRAAKNRYLCFSCAAFYKITLSIIFSLLFIALSAPFSNVSAQISTNFTILDSLTHIVAERICAVAGNSITVNIKEHNATWLLRTKLVEVCPNSRYSQSDTASCVVGFSTFGVHYERLSDADDSLRRICAAAVTGTYINSDGTLSVLPSNIYSYQDIIAESDVVRAESGSYDFTRAAVPPPPYRFLRDIVEPFVVITTAALTVFLLFSVRSQ